jgi:hypothetical protein
MKCGYSREILALYIEDDLPALEARNKVEGHVSGCAECREYCERLQRSQSLIKSRFRSPRQEPITTETLAGVRRAVMSQIGSPHTLGWAVRLERFLMLGISRPKYAVAGFAIVAILSASLLGQIQHAQKETQVAGAVFIGKDKLVRPAGYREWVFAGSSAGEQYHNVYINPAAYREYVSSGRFPEGTVMVREIVSAEVNGEPGFQGSYEKDLMTVEVSVKDSSRFEDGWGYFDFTEGTGNLKADAEPLPNNAGCLSCHREKAATDHVFTQFYPVLRLSKAAQL